MTVRIQDLPKLALSVRQPWAWAIIHGGKDFENRDWKSTNPGLKFTGRVCIHASKGMTRDEYESTRNFIRDCGAECPEPHLIRRGGIIGTVEVTKVVKQSDSPWFFGPLGLELRDPRPCEFIPSAGQLGFFKWQEADASIVPEPAKWMLEGQAAAGRQAALL